jgi:hypothetical protein
VLPPHVVESWVERFLKQVATHDSVSHLALMQMARYTGDRYRDLAPSIRDKIVSHLNAGNAQSHLITLVRHGGTLESDEANQVFGEALPTGLRLR